jgi:hypothetical protein
MMHQRHKDCDERLRGLATSGETAWGASPPRYPQTVLFLGWGPRL